MYEMTSKKDRAFGVPRDHKEGCGGGVGTTLEEIQSVVVLRKPDSDGGIWCPTKVSRNLTTGPGEVILFVKKPIWWQSRVAGKPFLFCST